VIDDRDDVWLSDTGMPLENLLKIPGYYYTNEKHDLFNNASYFEKAVRECAQTFDFDLTLLVFQKHLQRIHNSFFKGYETQMKELQDTKFYIRKLQAFSLDKVVSFEKLVSNSVDLNQTFEG